jgi:hypothetical protein
VVSELVFNADETGLAYKSLGQYTLVLPGQGPPQGRKQRKDRMTAMVCANQAGNLKIPICLDEDDYLTHSHSGVCCQPASSDLGWNDRAADARAASTARWRSRAQKNHHPPPMAASSRDSVLSPSCSPPSRGGGGQ